MFLIIFQYVLIEISLFFGQLLEHYINIISNLINLVSKTHVKNVTSEENDLISFGNSVLEVSEKLVQRLIQMNAPVSFQHLGMETACYKFFFFYFFLSTCLIFFLRLSETESQTQLEHSWLLIYIFPEAQIFNVDISRTSTLITSHASLDIKLSENYQGAVVTVTKYLRVWATEFFSLYHNPQSGTIYLLETTTIWISLLMKWSSMRKQNYK